MARKLWFRLLFLFSVLWRYVILGNCTVNSHHADEFAFLLAQHRIYSSFVLRVLHLQWETLPLVYSDLLWFQVYKVQWNNKNARAVAKCQCTRIPLIGHYQKLIKSHESNLNRMEKVHQTLCIVACMEMLCHILLCSMLITIKSLFDCLRAIFRHFCQHMYSRTYMYTYGAIIFGRCFHLNGQDDARMSQKGPLMNENNLNQQDQKRLHKMQFQKEPFHQANYRVDSRRWIVHILISTTEAKWSFMTLQLWDVSIIFRFPSTYH